MEQNLVMLTTSISIDPNKTLRETEMFLRSKGVILSFNSWRYLEMFFGIDNDDIIILEYDRENGPLQKAKIQDRYCGHRTLWKRHWWS